MNEVRLLLDKLALKSAELAVEKGKKMDFLHRISRPSITKEELERTISCEISILEKVSVSLKKLRLLNLTVIVSLNHWII